MDNKNTIQTFIKITKKLYYTFIRLYNSHWQENISIEISTGLINDDFLIQPKQNKNTESYAQKIDSLYSDKKLLTPDIIRKILNEWIAQEYNPTHFLTVQLPDNQKTNDLYISINHLRRY